MSDPKEPSEEVVPLGLVFGRGSLRLGVADNNGRPVLIISQSTEVISPGTLVDGYHEPETPVIFNETDFCLVFDNAAGLDALMNRLAAIKTAYFSSIVA